MAFCLERSVECVATVADDRLGYATSTEGLLPVNGLRHPAAGGTCGWYIWCGEELSQTADFFELQKLLGLSPGYRFLLAPGYLDIWFDASLLLDAETQ